MDDLEQFKKDMQDTHERLKGATVEYHEGREDNYMLHGVLARLQAVYNSPEREYWDDSAGIIEYDTAIKGLIQTLQAYLSQG